MEIIFEFSKSIALRSSLGETTAYLLYYFPVVAALVIPLIMRDSRWPYILTLVIWGICALILGMTTQHQSSEAGMLTEFAMTGAFFFPIFFLSIVIKLIVYRPRN